MENILRIRNHNNIIKLLIVCLVLALAPVIIASSIFPEVYDSGVYSLIVGVFFIMQVILLVLYFLFFTEKSIIGDFVLLLFFLIASQCLTIYSTILMPIKMNYIDIINAVGTIVSFFILVCIPSKIKITQNGMTKFFMSILILGIIACLYNLVINFQDMLSIGSIKNSYEVNFSSYYLSRNAFAQFIFFAIIANTYLLLVKKQKLYYFIYILLGISLLTTLSRGGIAATVIFGLVMMVFTLKERLVRNLLIMLFSLLVFILLWSYPATGDFIASMLIREDVGSAGRLTLWLEGISFLNQTNWFFGAGEFTSIDYFHNLGYTTSEIHSFYIETLVKGGLILLLFYIFIFVLLISRYRIINSADKKVGMVYISALVSLLFYGLVESISFFTIGYVGTLFTIFFITVPILYSNNFLMRDDSIRINRL